MNKKLFSFFCILMLMFFGTGCINIDTQKLGRDLIKSDQIIPLFQGYGYDANDKLFVKKKDEGTQYSYTYLYGKNDFLTTNYSGLDLFSFSGTTLLYKSLQINIPKELIGWASRMDYSGDVERGRTLRFSNVYEPIFDKVHENNKVIYLWTNNYYKDIGDSCIPKTNQEPIGDRPAISIHRGSFMISDQMVYKTLFYYDDSLSKERVGELCWENNATLYKIGILGYSTQEIENILHTVDINN